MGQWKRLALAMTVLTAACQSPTQPASDLAARGGAAVFAASNASPGSVTGGGIYRFADTSDVRFNFNAVARPDGSAVGHLFQSFVFGGELIEFRGRVTCVSFDEAEGRAWVGGVVTENTSTHPQFTTPRTQVGRDIWFRVLDGGEGANADEADRSTIPGFEGDRNVVTSAEYCATRPWVEGNVATHPLTDGNIQVKP